MSSTSSQAGVYYESSRGKWRARGKIGKSLDCHLGYFATEEEAIKARKEFEDRRDEYWENNKEGRSKGVRVVYKEKVVYKQLVTANDIITHLKIVISFLRNRKYDSEKNTEAIYYLNDCIKQLEKNKGDKQ